MIENRDKLIMEARTAWSLDGDAKCRQPERVEDGGYRSVATVPNTHLPEWFNILGFSGGTGELWQNGLVEEKKQDEIRKEIQGGV